ncbi:hypothetical protein [Cytobacillus praedii]|uniref:Uncharacterized protein n=1 Tax=Cytobacillus praedii TaxID=1742358 RepID=A0A4R1ALN6_9BACI|nr:hypothetical protein [Cytobacillus praedii]TCJ00503.1 hypothetical protein E0Y62_26635 [Cytobacillus praedii]
MNDSIHVIDCICYIETDDKPVIGDYVISSEQIGIPRIYKVYFATEGKTVLGKYSRGHTNLSKCKTLKRVNSKGSELN